MAVARFAVSLLLGFASLAPAQDRQRLLVTFDEESTPARQDLLLRARAGDAANEHTDWARVAERCARDVDAALEPCAESLAAMEVRVVKRLWLAGGAVLEGPRGCREAVAALPGIRGVWEDQRRGPHLHATTSANNHNADWAHTSGVRGAGAVLALFDSGIDADSGGGQPHPAFRDATGGSRILAQHDVATPGSTEDEIGHGTAVAAVALARDWNVTGADDGFAPDAGLVSYKITHDAYGNYWDSDLISALSDLLLSNPHGVQVLNFSYRGSPSPLHPTQQAMDTLAYFGDILIVTSAGNDGVLPNPTASSPANCNGISVAALDPDTHELAPFSSRGPLIGDPERRWPDIAAVGTGVLSAAPDLPGSTSGPLAGTSFAAPAVAGTALLLRAEHPELTALDTKALLLNTVHDLQEENPQLDEHAFGIGMLRSDYALRAADHGSLFGGSLAQTGEQRDFAIPVVDGELYAATLAWPRIDVNSLDWDDLRLEVIDRDGVTLAVADSPRNLYERVLFRARHSDTYTLRVVGAEITSSVNVDWSLAFAPVEGGGRQAGTYELSPTGGCQGSGQDTGTASVLPQMATGRFGDSSTQLVFGTGPHRLQFAIHADEVPTDLRVEQLAFRRDELDTGVPSFAVELEVRMGHTHRSPAQLSEVFDENPARDPDQDGLVDMVTVVPRRWIEVPGMDGERARRDRFDFVIPLTVPFTTHCDSGAHLLVELCVFGQGEGKQPWPLRLDAEQDYTRIGRVLASESATALQGEYDALAPVIGLLTTPAEGAEPRMAVDQMPQLGETMRFVLRDAAPDGLAALLFAFGPLDAQSTPLAGAPGCELQVTGPDTLLLPVATDQRGQTWVPFTIPNDPALSGVEFHNQFVVLDPGANAQGLVLSDAGSGRIGG